MRKTDKKHHRRRKLFYFGITPFIFLIFGLFVIFSLLFPKERGLVLSAFKMSRFTSPKPLVLSTKTLPANVQNAIEDLAKQEISQQEANATLPNSSNTISTSVSNASVTEPFIDGVQIALTQNSVEKAKLRLRRIDRYVAELQNLLENDRSSSAVNKAVGIIQNIGQETGKVVADPKAQADRDVLTLIIQQYNRLELTIQKVEDVLPIDAYLKIEGARVKYLLKPAQDSLNSVPNLGVVNSIGIAEVKKIVGNDYAEVKAIEILTDLGSGFTPQTSEKLTAIQKELAIAFEKRMVKLPVNVRQRKLSNYINFSYGNPINQVKAFDKMQDFLTDREVILGVHNLKELALKKLSDRISDTTNPVSYNQFLDTVIKNPNDLEVITQLQLQKNDQRLKNEIAKKTIDIFGKDPKVFETVFTQEANKNSNLSDVATITYLQKTLESNPSVGPRVKATVAGFKRTVLNNFLKNINEKGFRTTARLAYNPVLQNADVRILIPNPSAITLLNDLKTDLSFSQKSTIDRALSSISSLTAQRLLSGTIDPEVFNGYVTFLNQNPAVKQVLEVNLSPAKLQKATEQINKIAKIQDQKLFEAVQQITQKVFITDSKTNVEKLLPDDVQQEISQLKTELPSRNIPQLTVPDDVTLPKIAKLPDTVETAIVTAAQDQIKDKNKPEELKLNLDNLAKDLGVSVPSVLPDSPFYLIKEVIRTVELVVTIDPAARAELLLKQDNEKTVEAAKLIEESQSQDSIDLALKTLASVSEDFNKLKAHTDEVIKLAQTEPAKVDQLVSEIIDNGLARQTVFSEIENNVHGDTYVKVEEVRTEILANGIDTLLKLTNNDVAGLTKKLETAVSQQQGGTLSDIKAVELLNEIARTQPEETQKILQVAETKLAQNLETKLLEMPEEKRVQTVLAYADNATGNPVRQFEAYDVLKDNFTNPNTILLTEGLKDTAVSNLQDRLSEITDADSTQKFVEKVIGSQPQDLKVVTEIELRVEPPANEVVTQVLPTVEKIQDIKANIEQGIVNTYQNDPQGLANADFFDPALTKTPDIVDIKVAQEVNDILAQSPQVSPEVIQVAKEEEKKIIDTFIKNVSSLDFQTTVSTNTAAGNQSTSNTSVSGNTNVSVLAAETLNPIPETLSQLIELKTEFPSEASKIDVAINTQVDLMQEHLVQIKDPTTFETYVTQISQDPLVAQTVSQAGGTTFATAIEEKTQSIEKVAVQEQMQLQTTVAQVEKEIFTTAAPSSIEQTLPQPVRAEIQQIKQEVPAEQIPQITVQAAVEVQTQAPTQSSPATAPAAPAPEAPAPAAPEVKAPETQSAPAAPAAPGL